MGDGGAPPCPQSGESLPARCPAAQVLTPRGHGNRRRPILPAAVAMGGAPARAAGASRRRSPAAPAANACTAPRAAARRDSPAPPPDLEPNSRASRRAAGVARSSSSGSPPGAPLPRVAVLGAPLSCSPPRLGGAAPTPKGPLAAYACTCSSRSRVPRFARDTAARSTLSSRASRRAAGDARTSSSPTDPAPDRRCKPSAPSPLGRAG